MSKTLNLVNHLLSTGRIYQQLGLDHRAFKVFGRLGDFHHLPVEAAREIQGRLADLHLAHHRYTEARRHLAALLAGRPGDARAHYRIAQALDLDDEGDVERAREHYRRSLELLPDQPDCLGDYGLLCLTLGDDEEGIQALRRAVELAPDDPETVGKLVEGLCEAERGDEARLTLRAALFRNPRHPGFRKLWNDFRFQQLSDAQAAERRQGLDRIALANGPILLPFVAPPPGEATTPRKTRRIRKDGPASPAGPHAPYPAHWSDRKHA
jgi:tetratricopeptide (TPR) repeat protein